MLSFIGVYYITSDRKQEESDEQLLLTNADLFPGMLICHMGGVDSLGSGYNVHSRQHKLFKLASPGKVLQICL